MLALLIAVAMLGQTNAAPSECWIRLPSRPQFTAAEQVRALQSRITSSSCDVAGVTWAAAPARHALLLWESTSQTLWRVTVDGATARWERWGGASKARILADDPADGFTLGAHTEGKGRAPMSPAAGGFVKQQAPGTFDEALPLNCDAPPPTAPARGNPPFLTKCG